MDQTNSLFKRNCKIMCTVKNSKQLFLNVLLISSIIYLWSIEQKFAATIFAMFSLANIYFGQNVFGYEHLTKQHVIVITGCDSGLGYSLAHYCQALGVNVIAGVLKPDGPGARKLALLPNTRVYCLNLTDTSSVAEFANYVRETIEREKLVLKALVSNAGVMIFGEFEWLTEEQMLHQIDVNLLGSMRITRALLPVIRTHSARIILVSSHCSKQSLPGLSVYGASKAAIDAWATSIRMELKKFGVKVISFIPGCFIGESNLMARQKEHFHAMETNMPKEIKEFYGDYFNNYAHYFSSIIGKNEPTILTNSAIYETFGKSLLKKYPSSVYKCESWRYFFYHLIFEISPTCVRDKFIEYFMRLPVTWQTN